MGRVISPTSEEGKELQKWEQFNSHWNGEVIPAGNPYVFRPYPAMLYRAIKKDNGKVVCMEPAPNPYHYTNINDFQRAELMAEAFTKSCQKIVHSESDEALARGQGWCKTPQAALDAFETAEQAIGTAAAEANAAVLRMTERAKAEHEAAENSTHEHVTDVVGTKRGPKAKTATEA